MSYLNFAVMKAITPETFRTQQPYPWINPRDFINKNQYGELLETLPNISIFRTFFGKIRNHGQRSHDRYILDYEGGIDISPQWKAFIKELRGSKYRKFVCSLLDVSHVRFRFHWHFTPNGAEVSPHCDSRAKIGSHIFYLNTENDWQQAWGGQTLILDDGGRIAPNSAPKFDDFDREHPAEIMNNRSLIFGRDAHSWHGMRQVSCPEDHYRKVFIVVFEKYHPIEAAKQKFRRLLSGERLVTAKERLMY